MAGQEVDDPVERLDADAPKRTWSDAEPVSAWTRWHEKMLVHQAHLTQALLLEASPSLGSRVLDLGSGLGDPAMSIARRVGITGLVVATDGSPGMVHSLESNLARSGVENVEVRLANANAIPFEDASFELVSCKLGVVYFSPIQTALREIWRVLRKGGKFVTVTWGMPDQGNYFNSCVLPFILRSNLAPPGPDEPTPVRFSPPTSLSKELLGAGFTRVKERRHLVEMIWPGPPEELFRQLYETAITIRPIFDSLDPDAYVQAHAESMNSLAKLYDGKVTRNTVEIVICSGVR
jgi:ubiquinone/menaquinone biosynthesis C-methylase UbiE